MTGQVIDRRPMLTVTFRLKGMPNIGIEFVVDTGFTDYLTLPPDAIVAMQLPFSHRAYGTLADGSPFEFDVFGATIVWNSKECVVPVVAMGKRPLLGTSLLEQQELRIEFIEEGKVIITEMEM